MILMKFRRLIKIGRNRREIDLLNLMSRSRFTAITTSDLDFFIDTVSNLNTFLWNRNGGVLLVASLLSQAVCGGFIVISEVICCLISNFQFHNASSHPWAALWGCTTKEEPTRTALPTATHHYELSAQSTSHRPKKTDKVVVQSVKFRRDTWKFEKFDYE